MSKFKLPTSVTRAISKSKLTLKKHSPTILVVAGVVGFATSTVLACKATLKAKDVTTETKKKAKKIHEAVERGCTEIGEVYNAEDSKKDLTIIYTQAGLEYAKLYGPSVVIGGLSAFAIFMSHRTLNNRYLAASAAYMAEHTAFKEYKDKVVKRFGSNLDKELKYDIKEVEVEETVVNEDGTESKVKKTVQVANIQHSAYARFFDEFNSSYWERDAEYNRMFLHRQQDYANDKLREDGFLFLNDVYKMLGMDISKAGQHVGWVLNGDGDGYVDFGIFDNIYNDERKQAFVNCKEKSILLDFNVDGDIYELMK